MLIPESCAMHPYRHLTIRHEQHLLQNITPELAPGEVKFNSYFLPSLQAGQYKVDVNQTVKLKDKKDDPKYAQPVSQTFTVLAPRYNIPETAISSVYPPPADQALCKTLPHIVFNDPHFPWERAKSTANDDKDGFNQVPWVALIAFTENELRMTPEEAAVAFQGASPGDMQPNENLGYDFVSVDLLTKLPNLTKMVGAPVGKEKKQKVSIICVKKALFSGLFSQDGKGSTTKYKYLAHVRKVATAGMVSAIEGTTVTLSSIVSPRPGPFHTKEPSKVFVHLVTLEGIDKKPMSEIKERVAMVSLYSWSYTSLPPDSWDVKVAMEKLGTTLTVLRTDEALVSPPQSTVSENDIEHMIQSRQRDGYTLVKHRTVTGEETAAMYRGPLVPRSVPRPFQRNQIFQSNFGTDFSILDPKLGLMDITYSTAWQLGRTLALGDQSFTAALARLRTAVHATSLAKAQENVQRQLDAYSSKEDLLYTVQSMVEQLHHINDQLHTTMTTSVSINRWKKDTSSTVNLSLNSPHIMSQIYEQALATTVELASSPAGGPYNSHQVPNNTDWAIVQDWILDKIHLHGVPAHHLIPDSSYLPQEALRFFYFDENWADALIDGSLSLANQLAEEMDVDHCRTAIKQAINEYLRRPMTGIGYAQQLPKYGFMLRSQVLVKFPDLTVNPQIKRVGNQADELKPPILIQRSLASDTMLCLFDCEPDELVSIRFTLPPHQQTFSIGSELNADMLRVTFKNIYTNPPQNPKDRPVPQSREFKRNDATKIFDWDSRSMMVEEFAKFTFDDLTARLKNGYQEGKQTSAMLALQLNEPIYTLDISMNPDDVPRLMSHRRPRQFQFRVPEFPKHRFKASALPSPKHKPLIPRQLLHRRPKQPLTAQIMPRVFHNELPQFNIEVDRPKFDFNIFAMDATMAPQDDPANYIPTGRPLPIDLVFRIAMSADQRSKYQWDVIKFEVKVMSGDENYKPPKLSSTDPINPNALSLPMLLKNYEPPPPTMLSNIRFNVLKIWSHENMILQVVPRGKPMPLRRCADASFQLPLAKIVDWKTETQTYVSLRVYYTRLKGTPNEYYEDGKWFKLAPDIQSKAESEHGDWEMLSDVSD